MKKKNKKKRKGKMDFRYMRHQNDNLLIDNLHKREQNEHLLKDLESLKRNYGHLELEKEKALSHEVKAHMLLEDRDRALLKQKFYHDVEFFLL